MANKPNNPSLWSKAKSMAKQKYDVYPSAYANGWAAKWYKSKGGTWRSKAKESEYIRHMYQTSGPFSWSSGSLPNNVPVAKPQSTIGYGHSQTQPSKVGFKGEYDNIMPGNQLLQTADKAVGKYLVQPAIELVNTPFATFAEGVNAVQGKEYDFNRALPNPTRIALNAEGMTDAIAQQQFLSDYLGVDRKKNPYLAMGLDVFTPGPAMFTKPITALTGIGKAGTNTIKYAPKMNALDRAISNPISFVKKEVSPFVSRINENTGLRFVDQTIDAQKALQQTNQNVINPVRQPQLAVGTTQAVTKEYTPWTMQEMPGLHLQSTMSGGPIEQMAKRSKTGDINVQQALAIIKKESGGAEKEALIRNAFGENIPEKMNYNNFRKIVQDQLIPLEKNVVSTYRSKYGIDRLGYTKGDYNAPLENQTVLLSNKNKFGKGSSAHQNPEETLGHMHFLRDEETPDILTVTQIQSDAFQGTHRTMPKNRNVVQLAYDNTIKDQKRLEDLYSQATPDPYGGLDSNFNPDVYRLPDGKKISRKEYESVINNTRIADAKNELEQFSQKSLLDKNHQERYLQELTDYAGKRGDVKKIRLPTSETAAKVQNYTPIVGNNSPKPFMKKMLNESNSIDEFIIKLAEKEGIDISDITEQEKNIVKSIYDEYKSTNTISKRYTPDEETILKKYSEQPKTIKKLFGKEPTIVTDSKGNTWYEFDIPDLYKQGKAEIKAFSMPGIIGGGAATAAGASQLNQKRYGGKTNSGTNLGTYLLEKSMQKLKQKYQTSGTIYVSDPNDPRLKSYNDSTALYNNYMNNYNTIKSSGKYYNTVETTKPAIYSSTGTWKDSNPNNKLIYKKLSDDFGFHVIDKNGHPDITFMSNKNIQPIATQTFTRKESKYPSFKSYDEWTEKIKSQGRGSFSEKPNEANWIGYELQKYTPPVQPIAYKKPNIRVPEMSVDEVEKIMNRLDQKEKEREDYVAYEKWRTENPILEPEPQINNEMEIMYGKPINMPRKSPGLIPSNEIIPNINNGIKYQQESNEGAYPMMMSNEGQGIINKKGKRKYQTSGMFIRPTEQDSMDVYNKSIRNNDFFPNAGYKLINTRPFKYNIKNTLDQSHETFTDFIKDGVNFNYIYDNGLFYKVLDYETGYPDTHRKKQNPNKPHIIEQREEAFGTINKAAPYGYYDTRIQPQFFKHYKNENSKDEADVFMYDPVAVKPFIRRSAAEHKEFQDKYGKYGSNDQSKLQQIQYEKPKPVRVSVPEMPELPPLKYDPFTGLPYQQQQIPDSVPISDDLIKYTEQKLAKQKRMYEHTTPQIKRKYIGYSPEDIEILNNFEGLGPVTGGSSGSSDYENYLDAKLRMWKSGKYKWQPIMQKVGGYKLKNLREIPRHDWYPTMEEYMKMKQDPDYRQQWEKEILSGLGHKF